MDIKHILDETGLGVQRYDEISGGDINHCFSLHTAGARYFLKLNDAGRYPGMLSGEAEGLHTLHHTNTLQIPAVVDQGITGGKQWLILAWLEKVEPTKNLWEIFGQLLALMHRHPQPFFGWQNDNYIGSLRQVNTRHQTWNEFFITCRVMPLVRELYHLGLFTKGDINAANSFCKSALDLFPIEPPALLHGDLWSGNFMMSADGPAVFDPAVYAGHREMDIAMTKLFGGFQQSFYDAYDDAYPLEGEWQERVQIAQLYPLLVHSILFGGHYVSRAREILNHF